MGPWGVPRGPGRFQGSGLLIAHSHAVCTGLNMILPRGPASCRGDKQKLKLPVETGAQILKPVIQLQCRERVTKYKQDGNV